MKSIMLTQKEIKFLNFIYKNLGGEYENYADLKQILKKKYGFNDKNSFELAYLYDKNFNQTNGDFSNVNNVKRLTYEQYLKSITPEILAVMQLTNDNDPENYNIKSLKLYDEVIHSEEGEFKVFKYIKNVIDYCVSIMGKKICSEDPYTYSPYTTNNTHIDRSDRAEYSINYVVKWFEENVKKETDVLIMNASGRKKYEEYRDKIHLLNHLLEKLTNATDEFNDYLKLHKLGKEEEDQEEYISLTKKIEEYKDKLAKALKIEKFGKNDDIDDITFLVDEHINDIDGFIEDLLSEVTAELKGEIYEDISRRLQDPPSFFIEHEGMDEQEFLNMDIVHINCDGAARDWVELSEYTYDDIMGHNNEYKLTIKDQNFYIYH